MDYSISLNASGNEVTTYHDFTACGDFPECHTEPPTCGCDDGSDYDEPPIGIVVGVRWFTFREQVAETVQRIRHSRKDNGPFTDLYLDDLRALLASRHDGGQR